MRPLLRPSCSSARCAFALFLFLSWPPTFFWPGSNALSGFDWHRSRTSASPLPAPALSSALRRLRRRFSVRFPACPPILVRYPLSDTSTPTMPLPSALLLAPPLLLLWPWPSPWPSQLCPSSRPSSHSASPTDNALMFPSIPPLPLILRLLQRLSRTQEEGELLDMVARPN